MKTKVSGHRRKYDAYDWSSFKIVEQSSRTATYPFALHSGKRVIGRFHSDGDARHFTRAYKREQTNGFFTSRTASDDWIRGYMRSYHQKWG